MIFSRRHPGLVVLAKAVNDLDILARHVPFDERHSSPNLVDVGVYVNHRAYVGGSSHQYRDVL